MVTVAIRALELEYLVKILDWGRSRYIFTDSDSTALYTSCAIPAPGSKDIASEVFLSTAHCTHITES
jgi:hypothetical protein